MTESVEEAVKRMFAHVERDGFRHEALHTYTDADGNPLYWRVRMRHPDSQKKFIRPLHLNGAGYQVGEPKFEGPKPLYHLHLLRQRPNEEVWFVEGESCADALVGKGLLAVTAGSASSHETVGLEPLRKRHISIWRDNDQDGADHMNAIAHKLIFEFECDDVNAVNVESLNLPEKGDCIDWLAMHPQATALDIQKLIVRPSDEPLTEVEEFVRRFVAYPSEHATVAHVLWIAHTHLMDLWDSTPRLAFLSPSPGSGKSRGLEVTELLVPNPVMALNVSAAFLFRRISADAGAPTILYDEIDAIFGPRAKENEDLRALINAGHRRHGMAGRCVVRGKEVELEELPVYCAVAMAGLGRLPETILSRCVAIRMKRRAPRQHVEPFRLKFHQARGHAIRERLARWSKKTGKHVSAEPALPPGVTDRDGDVWECLIAIADAAGGNWPERARQAAMFLVDQSKESSPSLGIRLLADIREVFMQADVLKTVDLLDGLHKLEEGPWGDMRGKPMTDRQLAEYLEEYGIKSDRHRFADGQKRGYRKSDFEDAWVRYLPSVSGRRVTPVTPDTKPVTATQDVTPVTDVTHVPEAKPLADISTEEGETQMTGSVSAFIKRIQATEPGSEAAARIWVDIEEAGLSEEVDAELNRLSRGLAGKTDALRADCAMRTGAANN